MSFKARLLNIIVALDVFLFACICLGNVKRGETASAAAWALYLDNKWQGRFWVPVIDTLLWFDPDHCRKSYYTFMRGQANDI